jgi:cytochrome c-type biogenesis protein CcmH
VFLCIVTLFAMPTPAFSVRPDEILKEPQLEARARALSSELRCMVCQNQTIDDSDAPLARDLRLLVRERLKAGDSDQQVLDFLVARFGEFVLLKPPFSEHTLLLWVAPLLVLFFGGFAILLGWRRQQGANRPLTALDPEEERRISDILR